MSILIKGIDLPEVYGMAILKVYECIDGRAIPREYKLSATQMQAIPPHGRLVDADELIIRAVSGKEIYHICSASTIIEAEPVKHGRWIKMSDAYGIYWACSECGEELPRYTDGKCTHDNPRPELLSIDRTLYCPNCGARMEEEP